MILYRDFCSVFVGVLLLYHFDLLTSIAVILQPVSMETCFFVTGIANDMHV